jgi:maleylpyruvate isomerase
MTRSLAATRRWMQQGTALLSKETGLDDGALGGPSTLPGWSRRHLLAHVAANASALGNLVRWAATGEPTPMYASPADRAAGIEQGSRLPADELTAWVRRSAGALEEAMTRLSDDQWQASVVTAQGQTVPASEVPWMRSREVYVHAVDLATGVSFADLPAGFLAALCDDVAGKRRAAPGPALVLEATDTGQRWELPGDGEAVTLAGPLAGVTAYLTGRPHGLTTAGGEAAPALPAWL